jgi:tetratricopeptide (TPR) repeat protein
MLSGLRHLSRFACAACLLVLHTGFARGEKPLTDYPPAAQVLYRTAEQLFEQGRFREALAAFDQAREEGLRDYPSLEVRRGECQRQLQDYTQAITTLSRTIEEGTLGRTCRH